MVDVLELLLTAEDLNSCWQQHPVYISLSACEVCRHLHIKPEQTLLALPPSPWTLSTCSSLKFLRPQENKFLPFPSRMILAIEELLIFWEVTPYSERKELCKRHFWSQTKSGEKIMFFPFKGRGWQQERWDYHPHLALDWPCLPPNAAELHCLPGLSLPGCRLQTDVLWRLRAEHGPPALCLSFLLLVGSFVLVCCCQPALFSLPLEQ